MQEIIQQAKTLDDQKLGELIHKLTSVLDKRQLKAKRVAEEMKQQMEAQQRVLQQISALAADNGLSLEQLGLVVASEHEKVATSANKKTTIRPENQAYILIDGEPKLVFTRKAAELLAKGEAYRFNQLTAAQQEMARAVTAVHNAEK